MVQWKIPLFALAFIVVVAVLSGCSAPETSPAKPIVVATVGAPTPIPTEAPEPTPMPTWTPTPTPVPPPVTLSDFTLTVVINGDQRPVSGDPDQDLQLDAQHATRQDQVSFRVANTGDATLEKLVITYQLAIPMTSLDSYSGQTTVGYRNQNLTTNIGTFRPGDGRDIQLESPPYGAMLQTNVTVYASWTTGSMVLYAATLEPNFHSGTQINPVNTRAVMSYGSANN